MLDGAPRGAVAVREYEVMHMHYDAHMTTRTTISLEDRLAKEVKRRASESGESVSAFIARVLDDSLKRTEAPEADPFRLITVGGAGVQPGYDLDRPRSIDVTDDEETWSRG